MSHAESMYSEIILDYYRSPRNKGKMEKPFATARDVNPACGDVVEIHLHVQDGKVASALFSGQGCAISQAAASMLCESIEGKTLEEVAKLEKEHVLGLLGVELSPMRLKCALLGFKVAKMAVVEKLGRQLDEKL